MMIFKRLPFSVILWVTIFHSFILNIWYNFLARLLAICYMIVLLQGMSMFNMLL